MTFCMCRNMDITTTHYTRKMNNTKSSYTIAEEEEEEEEEDGEPHDCFELLQAMNLPRPELNNTLLLNSEHIFVGGSSQKRPDGTNRIEISRHQVHKAKCPRGTTYKLQRRSIHKAGSVNVQGDNIHEARSIQI